jgi:hypothetical protein
VVASVVTINDLLDGHAALDIECLDRIYLNGYVPNLQVGGQVVTFLTKHLGKPIPSPAVFEQIGSRFRRAVTAFAADGDIPVVRFGKDDRKIDVMRPYQDRLVAAGRFGVAAIGVAQEFQPVWTAYHREVGAGLPHFTFAKATRRVSCYYFYVVDEMFGAGFVKICSYFPYPIKVYPLTEHPGGSFQLSWHVPARVTTVPACDRVRRAVSESVRFGGASEWGAAGERGSV